MQTSTHIALCIYALGKVVHDFINLFHGEHFRLRHKDLFIFGLINPFASQQQFFQPSRVGSRTLVVLKISEVVSK